MTPWIVLPLTLRVLVFPHLGALSAPQGRESQLAAVMIRSSSGCIAVTEDEIPVASGTELNFNWDSLRAPIRVRCTEPATLLREHPLRSLSYRGELIVRRSPSGERRLEVINQIGLEDYLEGVVSGEMPSSWPLSALGAQAIAARTYALWEMENSRFSGAADRGYDFDDTVQYQAYVGVPSNPEPSVAEAVRLTAEQVLTQGDGKPIKAYFHDDSGGHTEDASVVFPSVAAPYCVGKAEIYDQAGAPKAWSLRVASQALSEKFLTAGLIARDRKVLELSIDDSTRSTSGRATVLHATLDDGSTLELRATDIRFALGLRSTLFRVKRDTDVFVFDGSGWGHGVGMSQWGAKLLSEQKGWNAGEILRFYYTGVQLCGLSEPGCLTR